MLPNELKRAARIVRNERVGVFIVKGYSNIHK